MDNKGLKRELSPEEQSFLEGIIDEHENFEVTVTTENGHSDLKVLKKESFKRRSIKWIYSLLSIPLILTVGIITIITRAESLLGGSDSINTAIKELAGANPETVKQTLNQLNISWIQDFLTLYQYRVPIILSSIAILLLMTTLFIYIDIRFTKKEDENEQKYNQQ